MQPGCVDNREEAEAPKTRAASHQPQAGSTPAVVHSRASRVTDQATLFPLSDPLLYQRGSATSKDAARDFAKRARTIREMVGLYVLGRGSFGATYTEIMAGLNLCSGSVCARLHELVKSGDVVRTARRRGKSGVVVNKRFYGTAAA